MSTQLEEPRCNHCDHYLQYGEKEYCNNCYYCMHCQSDHSCAEHPQIDLFGYSGCIAGTTTLYTELGAHMCKLATKGGPNDYPMHTALRLTAVRSDSFFKLLLARALVAEMRKPLDQMVADYNCGGAYDIDKVFDDINQQMKERKML